MDTTVKVRQFQYENDSARRILEFLLKENAILKTRLAGLLMEKSVPDDFLETAELYQAWFIRKDEIINLMRQDIADLDGMLTRFVYENGRLKAIAKKQRQVWADLKKLQDAFNELRNRFNGYVGAIV